jgi:CopG family nickel-responsive transcriptional regulator
MPGSHDLMEELDKMIAEQGYQNRAEAIRDFTRAGMQQASQKMGKSGDCVAALVYVYDHAARDLSRRLVENCHGHHDLSLATLHVHLDGDNCMEVTALKGGGAEVQHFADHIIAERGVRYGRVVMIPTEIGKKKTAAASRPATSMVDPAGWHPTARRAWTRVQSRGGALRLSKSSNMAGSSSA